MEIARPLRFELARASVALAFAVTSGLLTTVPAAAQLGDDPDTPFVICDDQRYALCATAQCFVYDEVAYCACDMRSGNSISETDTFPTPVGDLDVCAVNAEGRFNGYMVSTYSFPPDALPGGPVAEYSCPGIATAGGGVPAPVAYAQCDGGICFQSTVGRRFPGFPDRLAVNEIICSCPIATSLTPGSSNPNGYQISGPYHPEAPAGQRCDNSACQQCSVKNPKANGTTLRVGAAAGVPNFLTLSLYGPPLLPSNQCVCKCELEGEGTPTCTVAEEPTS